MPLSIHKNSLLTSCLLACMLTPAMAQSPQLGDGATIRPDDSRRLDMLDATAGAGLLQGLAAASPDERAAIVDAFSGTARPANEGLQALQGEWSCQMIKLGGNLPVVVYSPFKCRAGADGSFEKLSGSQRTKGTIHQDGDRLVYLGTSFINGDTPPAYADIPTNAHEDDQTQILPDVGVVEVVRDNHARILFPAPYRESFINVLVLRK